MLSPRRSLSAAAPLAVAAILSVPVAQAQEAAWVPPQPPCDIRPGHHLINGGMLHLKLAAEAPEEGRRNSRLDQAYEVLTRAIRENKQGDNPAAWYYLGRYFVFRSNAWGADTSFQKAVELAPQCAEEVARYRSTLEPEVLASALRTWQDGKADSAVVLFHLASRLQPEDANVPLFMSMMYASQKQLDSASTYLEQGIELAGDDPNYGRRKRQAMLELARGYDAVGFESPVTGQITRTRTRRDSLEHAITQDSAMLADLIAEWSGKQLRPEVAQAVQRDSTTLANRLSSARAALPAAEEALRNDSAAVAQAMGPALEAYAAFLEAFPDDAETTLRLLRRYSLAGHGAEMEAMIQRLAGMDEVSVDELTRAGVALYNDSHLAHAVQLLEVATARNPYARNALFMMCRAYYTLQDDAKLAAAAWQLLQVDPLNPQSVRMMAAAWDLTGNRDSTAKYVALADTGIGWAVTVTQLVPTANSSIINGSVANITPHPLSATTLEFDFLDADGNVMATATTDVPALQPGGRQQINVQVPHGGAVAWRYRRR